MRTRFRQHFLCDKFELNDATALEELRLLEI
jgi:hypothetical protein